MALIQRSDGRWIRRPISGRKRWIVLRGMGSHCLVSLRRYYARNYATGLVKKALKNGLIRCWDIQ
jgi:hypothetical protein